ncbi:hypothetical protein [Priestia megaterium]|uniref:hypothetical protein n=1 Tax=Priestia megaterium TaxID=1404 RepID=UPI0018CCC410|nr:hypothetical protein [Priestia megaterium]
MDKMKKEKLTFKTMKKRHWAGAIIAGVALGSIIGVMIPSEDETAQKPKKVEQKAEKPSNVDWEVEVKKIVGPGNTTPTENFDKIMKIANSYQPTEKEIKYFTSYIIQEYTDKRYISDIKNDDYMLSNIFMSAVVENYYDDSERNPIDAFAFDFFQNSKYTYRGVDAVDSDAVKSNEHQMDKSLAQLQ